MAFRINTSVRPWTHRLVSLCMAAALLAGIVPLPLGTSGTISKETSTPFPCQHHRCGCRSADQCWKKCCCFTNQQKLAWAKHHGVTPPAYVVAAANGEKPTDESHAQKCCATVKRSCHSAQRTHQHGVQHADCARASNTQSAKAASESDDGDTHYVIGALAQQCRGESSYWNSLPWSVLPPPIEMSAPREAVIDEWTLSSDEHRDLSIRPPVPPPRAA